VRRLDAYWEEQRKGKVVAKRKVEMDDVDDILDEIEDEEVEDADELDAEDDPTVEAPKTKRSRSKAASTRKGGTKKAKGEGGIGTAEVAEAAGTDSRSLRMLLRAEFPREEGGRYHWKSLNDPEVKRIIKRVQGGGTKEAKAASLDKLKSSKATKSTAKKSTAKKTTTKKAASKKGEESAADAKKRRAAERRAARRAAAAEDDE
jgi:hypothetical protein